MSNLEVVDKPNASDFDIVKPFLVIMNICLVVLVIALAIDGKRTPDPVPPDDNVVITENIDAEMAKSHKQLLLMQADVCERTAKDVLEGKTKNSRKFFTDTKAYEATAQELSFADMNKINEKYIPVEGEGSWTEDQARTIAALQLKKAAAKRRLAK